MGPGHLAIGFAAKPVAPKVPLWILLVATEVLDLLCFAFLALGIESTGVTQGDFSQGIKVLIPGTIPWSHGLFMSLIWSLTAGGIAFLVYRERTTSAVISLVVFSHWVLDFIVHTPDLPLLFEGSRKVGLGMWATGPGLILSSVLEFALLTGGVAIYILYRRKSTHLKTSVL